VRVVMCTGVSNVFIFSNHYGHTGIVHLWMTESSFYVTIFSINVTWMMTMKKSSKKLCINYSLGFKYSSLVCGKSSRFLIAVQIADGLAVYYCNLPTQSIVLNRVFVSNLTTRIIHQFSWINCQCTYSSFFCFKQFQ
jgi:hypothetical protein